MPSLDAAQQRLTEAVDRLESALIDRSVKGNVADPDAEAQQEALIDGLDGLRAECVRLNKALEESESENETLRILSDDIAVRLDRTIRELDDILEN